MIEYYSIVNSVLASTPIRDRLKSKEAVILERIAAGGGATNWFFCLDENSLRVIEKKLRPGSATSFYFDGRIRRMTYPPEPSSVLVDEIIRSTGDCVVGSLSKDGVCIDSDIVTSVNEFVEFLSCVTPPSTLFIGAFPARDNDGENAVSVILPDTDGIVRSHPH